MERLDVGHHHVAAPLCGWLSSVPEPITAMRCMRAGSRVLQRQIDKHGIARLAHVSLLAGPRAHAQLTL